MSFLIQFRALIFQVSLQNLRRTKWLKVDTIIWKKSQDYNLGLGFSNQTTYSILLDFKIRINAWTLRLYSKTNFDVYLCVFTMWHNFDVPVYMSISLW